MRVSAVCLAVAMVGCGQTDGDDGATDSGKPGQGPVIGELPVQPSHAGVAYVAHFESDQLLWTRTDKDKAVSGGALSMAGVSHSMSLDSVNDVLSVVHDAEGKVALYSLDRPKNDSTPVEDPQLITTVSTDGMPLFSKLDAYHERLYVMTWDVSTDQSNMHIYSFDGAEVAKLNSFKVPTSAAWDIDTVRQVLFFYDSKTLGVHVFDLFGDEPKEMAGSPIPFGEWYPEENSWAFTVRNLRVDPWSARLYAGRPQGTLSELMAFSYGDVVPGEGTAYRELADLTQVAKLEDGFDLSVDHEERRTLLEAHTALPDIENGLVFLAGRAWNGTQSTDMIVPLDEDLQLLPGCTDDENGWCWLRGYYDHEPASYLMSEGAACIDTTNQVIVTTSVDYLSGESNGEIVLFSYASDGAMTPLLMDDGSNPAASVYPVEALCH
jgi:hypothetical protein